MRKTAAELVELIQETLISFDLYEWDGINGDALEDIFYYLPEGSVLPFEINQIDSYGGEGMGEEYWVVYEIIHDSEKYLLKIDGFYQSWDGTYWDNAPYLAEAYEKTITAYRKEGSKNESE